VRLRRLAAALAVLLLAIALAAAVPAGRAGLADAFERFFAGGEAPGTPVERDALPRILRSVRTNEFRELARSGDEAVIAYRTPSGSVCFDFGTHTGLCIPSEYGVGELFHGRAVTVWGPTVKDEAGRWVLYGLARDAVERVELRYRDGPPTTVAATNAYVLRARPGSSPTELGAVDADGREIDRLDVRRNFELAPVGG
jgi:hypothetical protein